MDQTDGKDERTAFYVAHCTYVACWFSLLAKLLGGLVGVSSVLFSAVSKDGANVHIYMHA